LTGSRGAFLFFFLFPLQEEEGQVGFFPFFSTRWQGAREKALFFPFFPCRDAVRGTSLSPPKLKGSFLVTRYRIRVEGAGPDFSPTPSRGIQAKARLLPLSQGQGQGRKRNISFLPSRQGHGPRKSDTARPSSLFFPSPRPRRS